MDDEHDDWTASTLEADPRSYQSDASAGTPADAAASGDSGDSAASSPSEEASPSADAATPSDAGGPSTPSADMSAGEADAASGPDGGDGAATGSIGQSEATPAASGDDAASSEAAEPQIVASADGQETSPDAADASSSSSAGMDDGAGADAAAGAADAGADASGDSAELPTGDAGSLSAEPAADGAEAGGDQAEPAEGGLFDGMKAGLSAAGTFIADEARAAGRSISLAVTGKAGLPPDLPKTRANEALGKLPPEDQAKVQALLDNAKSDSERSYITKALAAGHSPAELQDFAGKIAGKDQTWLNDNLRVVGSSSGTGIKQQWSDSCAPTSVEAIKGELDPIYAMKLQADNPNFTKANDSDGTSMNPNMAQDQKTMLVDKGGVAVPRGSSGGSGSNYQAQLNTQLAGSGLTFGRKVIGTDTTMDDALNTMQAGTSSGMPVPIDVGTEEYPASHAVVCTGSSAGPPRTFTIHDPYDGVTQTFTEDQIKNNQVSIAGYDRVTLVFPPSVTR